jgi:tetratricopeptide (TPR) repeat protein
MRSRDGEVIDMNSTLESSIILAVLLVCTASLAAQTTGTRLGGYNQKSQVVWLNTPREIHDIRKLLQQGQTSQAVAKAREYVASLQHFQDAEGRVLRYFALNAFCAALTKAGELPQAIATCSAAIDLIPARWQALNNRGTAYFVSGDYTQALQDYRRALSSQNEAGAATEIIQSNIRLAESRLAASQ